MPSPSPPRDTSPHPAPQTEPVDSRARSRSRSPRRSPPPSRKPKNFSGLKWKDSKRPDSDRDNSHRRGGDYDRGYDRRRDDRDERRRDDRYDRRDRDRDDRRRDERGERRRDDRNSERRDGRDGEDRRRDDRRREDRDRDSHRRHRDERDRDAKPRVDKRTAAPPAPASNEAMIIVTVNDRLGTKTQIPCLPSDPVKVLKAMVAAKIGRPMHEIMLKRQGERPFHDSLTLADYAISNGVQIDLELNTGD